MKYEKSIEMYCNSPINKVYIDKINLVIQHRRDGKKSVNTIFRYLMVLMLVLLCDHF
jgi:hypothetical protein